VLEDKEISVSGRTYKDISNDFIPQKIYTLRQSNLLNRHEFAAKVNKTVKTIVNWETGLAIPTKKNLDLICLAFDLEETYFQA